MFNTNENELGNTQFLEELIEASSDTLKNFGVNLYAPDQMKAVLENRSGKAYQGLMNVLTEQSGFTEQETKQFEALAESSANQFLTEARMSPEISVFAPFQLTLLQQIFSRRISRHLITSTAEATDSIKVGIFKTILQDTEGNEFDLKDIDDKTVIKEGWYTKTIMANSPVTFKAFEDAELNALDASTPLANRKLDRDFTITGVDFSNDGSMLVPTRIQVKEEGTVVAVVEWTSADGATSLKDRLIVFVDFDSGEIVVKSTEGLIQNVRAYYRLSNNMMETNDLNLFLKYDPDYSVTIGDGRLINVGIPLNYLERIKAFSGKQGMQQAISRIAFAHALLDDREVIKEIKDTVLGNPDNIFSWDTNFNAGNGISVVDYNREVLFKFNQAIASIDNNLQFSGINQFNVPINPEDVAYITSPAILENPKGNANNSVISGAYNYNTTAIVTPVGNLNLLSTKTASKGLAPIVPKSDIREERVVHRYELSTVFSNGGAFKNSVGGGFRNRQAPLINNIASLERKKLVVHEPKAIAGVEFLRI